MRMPPRIINGRFHSPFFIFIKEGSNYSDCDLLEKLGINNYLPLEGDQQASACLYITEDKEWAHVMDDWYYTLWHMKHLHDKLIDLSLLHDIFTCSVGEMDYSYDFNYYIDGAVVRRYIVQDSHCDRSKSVVVENLGPPMHGEELAFSCKEELDVVISLAESLGVVIKHDLSTIRCYGVPDLNPPRSKKTFSVDKKLGWFRWMKKS